IAPGPSTAAATSRARGHPTTGHAGALVDVAGQFAAQLPRVLRRQIDLVGHAIQPERHRLVRGPAVQVVNETSDCLLRHFKPPRIEAKATITVAYSFRRCTILR